MMSLKPFIIKALLVILVLFAGRVMAETDHLLTNYNVVWDSPSVDCNGSMPIGNGDLAANVWMEPNGDLLFYLSKSDSWSGAQELLKLGRVRVKLDPPFVGEAVTFKQELDLASGCIRISATANSPHSTPDTRHLTFWVDANNPVVNVEIQSSEMFSAQVALEPWRIPGASLYGGAAPDTVLPTEGNAIRWFQRNINSVFAGTLQNQHLGGRVANYPDPLINRTFGGIICGNELLSKDEKTLVTDAPVKSLFFRVHALTAQTDTAEQWISKIEKQRVAVEALALEETRKLHETW